ncbi:hypothetical protein [Streptomyces sp. NPDC057438]|uniref:hypothetical protein n=1 Tax=Streptomyces sp. NPDC057438 TaxID=3346133 RepID=UPI003699F67F
MKKHVRTLSAGLSMGVTILAATVSATTPAAAAPKSLNWHVEKSEAYCRSLPDRTPVQQMKKAECNSLVLITTSIVMNEAISKGVSTAKIAARKNWPGPGH